jgi:hypothetical protein
VFNSRLIAEEGRKEDEIPRSADQDPPYQIQDSSSYIAGDALS